MALLGENNIFTMKKSHKRSAKSIQILQKEIENQLQKALNEKGQIDEIKLEESNKPLSDIFQIITMSKTWRDDPYQYSKEVARLIAAKQEGNDLSNALESLNKAMKRKK